jgi:threonine dehydrogenase-like Zn-dependent dehydrogenase
VLAAVFEGQGKIQLKDRPEPRLSTANDVLIKVTGVGICGTDLHILQVPPAHPAKVGAILGHEFTGEVVETGRDVVEVQPGDRVLVDPHPGCGLCEECRSGHPDRCIPLYTKAEPGHCATIGIFSDGAMTSYVVVQAHALYRIGAHVPAHIAALAEPLACVVSAADKLKVQPGNNVVVLGAGPIGLLYTTFLKACGAAKVIVSEISGYRRQAARDCGATIVVNPQEEDLRAVVFQEMKARPQIPVAEIVRKEVTIHGGFIGKFSFHKLPGIIESGILPLEKIVSHRLALSRVHEGLDLLRKGQAIKVILHPED